MEQNKILFYQTDDGRTQIDVRLENDTVWLTQRQMADLFKSSRTNIIEHIQNIYIVGELDEKSICRKFRQVRQEGKRAINREITMFNLDMIISVGYRVNSKRGVKFRQWANGILKEYLIKGYSVNEKIRRDQISELRQLVSMLGRTIQNQPLISTDETNALFEVVTDYTYALDTLDNYDYQRLTISQTTQEERFHATYENAMEEIVKLRSRFGGSTLFGNEKDDSFSDGNKRIAATLFLWFLNENRILYRPDGSKRLPDNTLVAMTLMIAESRPDEKDIMVKVVVNLINQNN